MRKTIAMCGTFDSKGEEFSYLAEQLRKLGADVLSVDMSLRPNDFAADYSAEAVAAAAEDRYAGGGIADGLDRMSAGAGRLLAGLAAEKRIDGMICMGGGRGTYMACCVLREMPLGFPKVLISTCATNEGSQYYFEGIQDTMVMNPLVDISGLNSVLCMAMKEGAACVCAMADADCMPVHAAGRPRVGITMWGVTTPCVERVRRLLEEKGCEVLVFHANGTGGNIMDSLVRQNYFDVVADLTLSEITMPVARGQYTDPQAENRMKAACEMGIPQVVAFGGIDMVHPDGGDPAAYAGRKLYYHTASCVFYRSNAEETVRCVKFVADRLKTSAGKAVVLHPLEGTSAVNKEGEALYESDTNEALHRAVHQWMEPEIPVVDVDAHINDRLFAEKAAEIILGYIGETI